MMFSPYEKSLQHSPAEFKLTSPYQPAGDQEQAISSLVEGLTAGDKNQVLLGITGSGKTYTMAQVIQRMKRTALILAHNKILAAHRQR